MEKRFEGSEYGAIAGNKHLVDVESDFPGDRSLTVDPSKLVPADASRFVYGCRADNMRLPFPSEFFDSYVSNLSLMLVSDPIKQIQECYRVLKHNSRACYSVWGRPANCLQFEIGTQAEINLGRRRAYKGPVGGPYAISENIESIKEQFILAGFSKDIKVWY